jgi:zinc protease
MTRWLRFALLLASMMFALPSAARAEVFNPKSFTLDNGLQVVVISNHRAPVVTQLIMYKVGAMDESPGKSGIAHFFEHLMFKGTKTLKAGEFSAIVARNGGEENAFTSYDYTGYHQSVAVDRLETVMRIEADRMRNLLLTDDDIEPERKVVLEERNSRVNNNPAALLREEVNAAFFLNHPYRVPVIGWEHEIKALKRSDLIAFYQRWYAPNNAILVYAGDVTVESIRPKVERYFGGIAPSDLPFRPVWKEPPQITDRTIELRHKQVRQPSWSRRYMAPSFGTRNRKIIYPLEVLADIIGGGTTSRLYKSLVVEKKIAANAGASYDGDRRGPGVFAFYASPMPGKTLNDVEKAVDAEITRLLEKGVTADEVKEAIVRMQDAAIYARDGISAPANIVAEALAIGEKLEDVEAWPERIGKVTVKDVNAAIHRVLGQQGSVTARLLPEKKS